jgi:hypothetical protein
MAVMWQHLTRRTCGAALIVLATCGAFGSVSYAQATNTPEAASPAALAEQTEQTFTLEHFYRGTDDALKEFGAARSDHAAIALNIGQCYRDQIGDPLSWSPTVRAILFFELDEHLMHTLSYKVSSLNNRNEPKDYLNLHPFHAAAISFSDRVSRDRLEFRKDLEHNRSLAWRFKLLAVALAAGATIFASARSVLGDTRAAAFVGSLVIICSAGATAVSSMNSFEDSQATALRDQRALSQLQQLHWRIAADVLSRPNLCHQAPDRDMELVNAWRVRLETILDSAVESIAKPGDISSGRGPTQADPVKGDLTENPQVVSSK